jgi:hypothetical protein
MLALAVSPPADEDDSRIPDVPGYTIMEWIGNGGMGAVFRATQDCLGREIALKIINPALARDPAFAARFEREARILASLTHPHIVTIHDAGKTPDGRMFLAMEWVNGTDLARVLQTERLLPPANALRIIRQLCEALHAAHLAGVIHRDVKPSNILLTTDGHAKLADFGIALPAAEATIPLTRTGTSLGTPDFLPPEAFMPGFQPDVRADLFAAGVTLYQAITGTIPRGRFPKPSELVHGLDPRIDAIIDTALRHNPSQRFSSARAMAEAIAAVESKPFKRDFRIITGLIAVLALLAAGAAVRLSPANRRDAPNPPITALNEPPVPANPEYSAGQWIPAFRTAGSIQAHAPGVRWEDGWITPDPAKNHALCLFPSPVAFGANWGARATYRWNIDAHARGTITLRKRFHQNNGQPLSEHYLFEVYPHQAAFFRVRQTPDGQHHATPIGNPMPLDLRDGQLVTIEAHVIDGTLFGKVNGTLLATAADGILSRGEFDVATYGMPFRDLAFIRLDGLPKDEALQAAGLK